MLRIIVLLATLAIALANAGKTITATVKDTAVNGVEGLNLKWTAPFKFQDTIVGFRTTLGDLRRAPEEIFAKRSFSTGNDGTATVDADYNIDTQQLNVATVWKNGQGLSVSAAGNNKDKVTKIGAETSTTVSGHSLNLAAAYDLLTKKVSTNTRLTVDDTKIQLKYDNADRDPVVEINHKLDDKNTVSPSISLKSGGMTYGWLRKINGGTIGATLHPGDKVEINWEDNGANGVWKTKAEVPLEDHSATKISFSRDWNY